MKSVEINWLDSIRSRFQWLSHVTNVAHCDWKKENGEAHGEHGGHGKLWKKYAYTETPVILFYPTDGNCPESEHSKTQSDKHQPKFKKSFTLLL